MTQRESFLENLKKMKSAVDQLIPYLMNTEITENMIKWDTEKLVEDNRQLKADYEVIKQAREIVKKESDDLLVKAKLRVKEIEDAHAKRMAEMQADRLNLQAELDSIRGKIYQVNKK